MDNSGETEEYKAFVAKFAAKKTTDDCYTPENIYAAVRDWAISEYSLFKRQIVRPFWPGGDYEAFNYPDDCVVIDNPPFSIITKICEFYDRAGIAYFLFAPALTLFSINKGRCNYIVTDTTVTYENGARVHTSFVTNLGRRKIWACAPLAAIVARVNEENTRPAVELPKYCYPDAVCAAAQLGKVVKRGIEWAAAAGDCFFIRGLDAQKEAGKSVFGAAFLLSEKAAAEKAAAEKAAAEKAGAIIWQLSERERKIIENMGTEQ